jgi:hypothetical protein
VFVATLAVIRQGIVIASVPVAGTRIRVGTTANSDVVLPPGDPGSAPVQVEVFADGAACILSSGGGPGSVRVGGVASDHAVLWPGVSVEVGPYQFILQAAASGTETVFGGEASQETIVAGRARVTGGLGDRTAGFRAGDPSATMLGDAPPVGRGADGDSTQYESPAQWASGGEDARAAAPGAARSKGGPIFLRPTVLLAAIGGVGLVLLAVLLQQWTAPSQAGPDAPQPRVVSPNEAAVAKLLDEARKAIARGDYETALADDIDRALIIEPDNAAALDLRQVAEEGRAKAGRTPRPPGGAVPAPEPGVAVEQACAVREIAGELSAEHLQRVQEANTTFSMVGWAIARADYLRAASALRALESNASTCEGAADLKAQITDGLRRMAKEQMLAADYAERDGDLVGARAALDRAREFDAAAPGLAQSSGRLNALMRTEGVEAVRLGKEAEKAGQAQKALQSYERALQLLTADAPERAVAQERVAALKSGIR